MEWKLELVPIPVSDVDRAKAFYTEKIGFEEDLDHSTGEEFRVVQLTPPGSACSIAVGTGRAELLERGAEVSKVQHFDGSDWRPGGGGDWNSFAFFSDPDGNGWVLQQSPGRG